MTTSGKREPEPAPKEPEAQAPANIPSNVQQNRVHQAKCQREPNKRTKKPNRQAHSTKQRLAAVEIMRPVAHEFLKQQRRYLQTQPFPLSKKANEVLKLQQNILNELAVAYRIIIQETVNRDSYLSNKKLVACVHHAMFYHPITHTCC